MVWLVQRVGNVLIASATWNLARQDCHENGGKLALPMDKAENDGIYDLYEKRAKILKRFWIDAIALDENFPLVYTTREGQELNFTQWRNDQPNDNNACGFMGTDLGSIPSVWADGQCNLVYDYICETKLQENKKGTCSFARKSVGNSNILESAHNRGNSFKDLSLARFKPWNWPCQVHQNQESRNL